MDFWKDEKCCKEHDQGKSDPSSNAGTILVRAKHFPAR
jgi:hypothetical protein